MVNFELDDFDRTVEYSLCKTVHFDQLQFDVLLAMATFCTELSSFPLLTFSSFSFVGFGSLQMWSLSFQFENS